MGDFVTPTDSYPILKALLWCFYPIITLFALELISNDFNDDDDDEGGGMMIPAYQGIKG